MRNWLGGKDKEKSKTEVKSPTYMTTEGVIFGGKNLIDEELKRRYEAAGRDANRLKIMDDLKEEWKIPKEVNSYMGNSLTVDASNTDKAKEIIRNNKDVLEERYGVKISDSVKLREF